MLFPPKLRPSCAQVARRHTRCLQRFCQAWAYLLRAVLTAFKWCIVCRCFVVPLTSPSRRGQKKQPILAPNVGWAFFRLRRAGAFGGVSGSCANFCASFAPVSAPGPLPISSPFPRLCRAAPSTFLHFLAAALYCPRPEGACSKGCRQNGACAYGASPVVSTT